MSEKSSLAESRRQPASLQNGNATGPNNPSSNYGAIDDISTATPTSHEPNGGVPPGEPGGTSMMGALDRRSTLKVMEKLGYGLGHVYNDLCAGVWFSYTLLFMQGALGMPAAEAGALVMLGQVGDAVATPIVGFLTDKYGTKRQWHAAGTLLVFLTFPLIFSLCPWCDVAPHWWQIVYFTIVILLFQFGWPIVQITHLAMIPELSRTQKDRSDLTAVRYSVSIVSNVVVYIVTWAVLRTSSDNQIGANDAYRFRDISLILTLVGVSMSVLFNFSLSFSGYEHRRHTALQHNVIKSGPGSGGRKERDPEKQALLQAEQQTSQGGSSQSQQTVANGTAKPAGLPGTDDEVVLRKPKKNFFKSPLLYQNALLNLS